MNFFGVTMISLLLLSIQTIFSKLYHSANNKLFFLFSQ